MTNELPVEGGSTSWTAILEKFHIPKLIAGPAGEALSRLVGKAIDIPSAKLEQIGEGIRDKTAAKSLVSKALSQEVAKRVVADRDLVQRAADSFLAKELRKQSNKESVAKKTIEILALDAKPDSSSPPNAQNAPEAVHLDDDWLNIFEQYAENASSERLQDLWSRTLAGEIRKPKTFSLQTLRFISELDQDTALLFEKHSDAIINDDFIPFLTKYRSPPHFADFLALEEAGLLSGSSGTLHKTFDFHKIVIFMQKGNVIIGQGKKEHVTMQVPSLLLTKIGRQVATLTDIRGSLDRARDFAAEMPKNDLDQIYFREIAEGGKVQVQPELLWMRQTDTPAKP